MKHTLFGIALRLTQNRMEAEDIVQDVLVKMWSLRHEWHRMDNLEGYCVAMTKNRALDKIKSSHFHAQQQRIAVDTIAQLPADSDTPQQQLERREHAALLCRIIGTLPQKQQQVVRLRELEEKNYREIAAELHLSEAQVKVSLFRARQKIKALLEKINRHGH